MKELIVAYESFT